MTTMHIYGEVLVKGYAEKLELRIKLYFSDILWSVELSTKAVSAPTQYREGQRVPFWLKGQ